MHESCYSDTGKLTHMIVIITQGAYFLKANKHEPSLMASAPTSLL